MLLSNSNFDSGKKCGLNFDLFSQSTLLSTFQENLLCKAVWSLQTEKGPVSLNIMSLQKLSGSALCRFLLSSKITTMIFLLWEKLPIDCLFNVLF